MNLLQLALRQLVLQRLALQRNFLQRRPLQRLALQQRSLRRCLCSQSPLLEVRQRKNFSAPPDTFPLQTLSLLMHLLLRQLNGHQILQTLALQQLDRCGPPELHLLQIDSQVTKEPVARRQVHFPALGLSALPQSLPCLPAPRSRKSIQVDGVAQLRLAELNPHESLQRLQHSLQLRKMILHLLSPNLKSSSRQCSPRNRQLLLRWLFHFLSQHLPQRLQVRQH